MTVPFTDLYIAPIKNLTPGPVFPPARQAQLEGTRDENTRLQRYAAWKLLEYALERSLCLALESANLQLAESGKWSCDRCFFSLSHCQGAVAVVLSDRPVGVDLEPADRQVSPGLSRKILTEEDLTFYKALPEEKQQAFLLEHWCAGESLFKAGLDGLFQPRHPDRDKMVCSHILRVDGRDYQYAVATPDPENIRIFTDIQL